MLKRARRRAQRRDRETLNESFPCGVLRRSYRRNVDRSSEETWSARSTSQQTDARTGIINRVKRERSGNATTERSVQDRVQTTPLCSWSVPSLNPVLKVLRSIHSLKRYANRADNVYTSSRRDRGRSVLSIERPLPGQTTAGR